MIRVAACQDAPGLTFEGRKHQIAKWLEQADQAHIDFICFPEGFLMGYYASEEETQNNSLELEGNEFQQWLKEIKHFYIRKIKYYEFGWDKT